jgi:hypothetical protein
VQRQYTGTAGRIENAQVAVYLTYAGARGHAMIDRELYLPKCWTDDPDRLVDAGVPDDIEFLTKPALAAGMLTRALRAGVPARWVTGDEVYGNDPGLRAECEAHQIGYVLAIGCDRRVPTAAGLVRADTLAADLPDGPGSDCPPERARRDSATTTGRGSPSPSPTLTPTRTPTAARGAGGCWSGAIAAQASWRSIGATPQRWCHCASWSASPDAAGRSRSPSRLARAWLGSMNIRCAGGPRGSAGPCWR